MPLLRYPDSDRRSRRIDDAAEAIEKALRDADELAVEVVDDSGDEEVLLAAYAKRETPLYPPEDEPADDAGE